MHSKMNIDWEKIGLAVGSIHPEDKLSTESGGTHMAWKAVELILGEETIHQMVKFILDVPPGTGKGSEIAMQILKLIHSEVAAKEAYRIYKNSSGQLKADAVYLIKHIASPASLPWVEEFLQDKDVAVWGIGVLDQLLWGNLIEPEAAKALLKMAESHTIENVREQTEFIREYLKNRD